MVAVLCSGCALIEENETVQKEKWLAKAGFQAVRADTPSKRASLNEIPPYTIQSRVEGKTVLYRYANPAAGVLYIGGPGEYAAYKRIAVATRSRRASSLAQITPNRLRTTGPLVW